MLDANGSYVKVYLYLSMCIQSGEKKLSISSLADKMENTEKDIIRALRYWEKRELMILQRDASGTAITSIEIINPDNLEHSKASSHTAATEAVPQSIEEKDIDIKEEIPAVSSDTINTDEPSIVPETNIQTEIPELAVTEEQTLRLSKDEGFSWTCLIVESYLERPLKTTEVQLLTYLFDTLKFSKELILHLYEYCCSLGKTNVNYVQAVALSWAEQHITTPEQAKAHSSNYSTVHAAIAKALALGRPLAKIECTYVERWQNQWHMDLAVILEACNRTMLSIQKADFNYLEGILNNWHKENVHTLQDIQACDEAHNRKKAQKHNLSSEPASTTKRGMPAKKTQFQNFQQRNTSKEEIDQLEKMLLTR